MKKTYLILAHHMPQQLERLVRSLTDGESDFLIHVDKNSDMNQFSRISLLDNVRFIEQQYYCSWGDFSIVEAMLALLRNFCSDNNGSEYGILLSGQDYPIVSNNEINEFFESRKGINFQNCRLVDKNKSDIKFRERLHFYRFNLSAVKGDYVQLPFVESDDFLNGHSIKSLVRVLVNPKFDDNYKVDVLKKISKPRSIPDIPIHFGSQWFCLTADVISKILSFVDLNENFVEYHRFSHVPDESFIPTILKHLQALDPLIKISGYLTYVDWNKQGGQRPAILDMADKNILLNQQKSRFLFARKFESDSSSAILDLIDQHRKN